MEKLSLEKFQDSKLENLQAIKGGGNTYWSFHTSAWDTEDVNVTSDPSVQGGDSFARVKEEDAPLNSLN